MTVFNFEMITPDSKPYSGKVKSLTIPGKKGSFGVWANHAALISACTAGTLRIREESERELRFETGGGFFEVVKNRAVFLAGSVREQTAA